MHKLSSVALDTMMYMYTWIFQFIYKFNNFKKKLKQMSRSSSVCATEHGGTVQNFLSQFADTTTLYRSRTVSKEKKKVTYYLTNSASCIGAAMLLIRELAELYWSSQTWRAPIYIYIYINSLQIGIMLPAF